MSYGSTARESDQLPHLLELSTCGGATQGGLGRKEGGGKRGEVDGWVGGQIGLRVKGRARTTNLDHSQTLAPIFKHVSVLV
jgi:hypothetical protein